MRRTIDKTFNFLGGLVFGALFGGLVGGIAGLELGDLNAEIDFCTDSTADRYIKDDRARRDACE